MDPRDFQEAPAGFTGFVDDSDVFEEQDAVGNIRRVMLELVRDTITPVIIGVHRAMCLMLGVNLAIESRARTWRTMPLAARLKLCGSHQPLRSSIPSLIEP